MRRNNRKPMVMGALFHIYIPYEHLKIQTWQNLPLTT